MLITSKELFGDNFVKKNIKKVNQLSKFLKNQRVKASFSQADLSKQLGYTSPQIVSNWERGICAPPLNILYDLVTLLKIDKKQITELLIEESRRYINSFLEKGESKKHG